MKTEQAGKIIGYHCAGCHGHIMDESESISCEDHIEEWWSSRLNPEASRCGGVMPAPLTARVAELEAALESIRNINQRCFQAQGSILPSQQMVLEICRTALQKKS